MATITNETFDVCAVGACRKAGGGCLHNFATRSKNLVFNAFATIFQDKLEDEVFEPEVDVSTRLQNFEQRRRPNVVCQEPLSEDAQIIHNVERCARKQESAFKKAERKMRQIFEHCPYSHIPQRMCWCLHYAHNNRCDDCGTIIDAPRTMCDRCIDNQNDIWWSDFIHETNSNIDTVNRQLTNQINSLKEDVRYIKSVYEIKPAIEEHMPGGMCYDLGQEPNDYNNSVDAIGGKLREVAWNICAMQLCWKGNGRLRVEKHCEQLNEGVMEICQLLDKFVYSAPNYDEREAIQSERTLPRQKERMFVYTSNIAIRLREANKIVNDDKGCHHFRAKFIGTTKAMLCYIADIRSIVNEARKLVDRVEKYTDEPCDHDVIDSIGRCPCRLEIVEQMEVHGDSNLAMPHQRKAQLVGFTTDRSKDESAVLKMAHDIDITDIKARCMIDSRLDVFQWSTASSVGTALARYRVSPNYCVMYTDSAPNRTFNQTALCNYANMYQFWKGSLIYTFEAVCTKFHMGQAQIAFNPANIAAPTASACRNLITTTMDLLPGKNRVEFKVEYVGETEYKQCVSSAVGPAISTDPYVDIANVGILSFFVQNPLIAPATVSSTIDINVYVRAGPDFEFAVPKPKTSGLKYYNVRGAVYEEMEVQKKEDIKPVIAQAVTGTMTSEELQIHRAGKVDSASTSSIIGRDYLLTTGVTWATSDTISLGPLQTILLPRAILETTDISINGLMQYHTFFRGTFDITFRLNAPIQFAGLLIMMYVPVGVDYTECSDATWTQFPHVFFDPAAETTATLKVPWSYVTPLEKVDSTASLPVMGSVILKVWNVLRTPADGVSSLTGSMWFRINDPYIGLKRTVRTVVPPVEIIEHMEQTSGGGTSQNNVTSDAAKKVASEVDIFQGSVTTKENIMTQNHMNILKLLQRVDFIDTLDSVVPTTAVWTRIATFPPFFGPMHNFLRNSFAFCNGGNKVVVIVPVGANRGVTLALYPSFSDADFSDAVSNTAVTDAVSVFYAGTTIWRPGLAFEHTVTVPFYHRDPLISIPDTTVASQVEYANVRLSALNNDTATNVFTQLGHTIAEDYRLYFPIAFGKFRATIPTLRRKPKGDVVLERVAEKLDNVVQNPARLPGKIDMPKQILPRPIIDHVIDRIVEHTGMAKDTVRDIGTSILHAAGKHDMATALAESLSLGRFSREADQRDDNPMKHGWPASFKLPTKKVIIRELEREVIDYENVFIYRTTPVSDEEITKFVGGSAHLAMQNPQIEEHMPMNGIILATVNTQTNSQAFPGQLSVGDLNVSQINIRSYLVNPLVTDTVNCLYGLSNMGDSVVFRSQLDGQGPSSESNVNLTIKTTPVNALTSFSISAVGTGAVIHEFNISSYVDNIPDTGVIVLNEPLHVTEYASTALLAEGAVVEEHMPQRGWFNLNTATFERDNFQDAQEYLSPQETDDANVFAESLISKMKRYSSNTVNALNPVSFFRDTFESIHTWCTDKCKASAAQQVKTKLGEYTGTFMDNILPVVIWMIDFVSNLYVLFNTESDVLRGLMIASLTAKCVLAYHHGDLLLNKLDEVIGLKVMQHMDVDKTSIAAVVAAAMVAGIIGILGYSFHETDSVNLRNLATWRFAESCAALNKVSSLTRSVPSLWSAANSGIRTAIDFFCEGPDVFYSWQEKNKDKLNEWQLQIDTGRANAEFIGAELFAVRDGKTNFVRLTELAEYAKEVKAHGAAIKHFSYVWLKSADDIIKIHANALKTIQVSQGRSEPVGILVTGKPGAGKSVLFSEYLPHAVMLSLGLTTKYSETKAKTYAKPTDPKQDYWDGYLGKQHVWVNVDDFGQSKTGEDIGQIINLISASDAPVNMAAIEDKGILFVSDFVCCTSNMTHFKDINNIRNTEALARRFPISLTFTVNKEFLIGNVLNHSKMVSHLAQCLKRDNSAQSLQAGMDQVWTVEKWDFVVGVSKGRTTFGAVVNQIVSAHLDRKKGKTDFTALLDSIGQSNPSFNAVGTTDDGLLINDPLMPPLEGEEDDIVYENMPRRQPWQFTENEDEEHTQQVDQEIARQIFYCDAKMKFQDGISYGEAQILLDKIKQCDAYHHYGITFQEYKDCIKLPDLDLTQHNWRANQKDVFLQIVGMVKRVPRLDSVSGPDGLPVSRWPGFVTFFLKWAGIVAAGVAVVILLKKVISMLFRVVLKPLEEGPQYDGSKKITTKAPSKMVTKPMKAEAVFQAPTLNERQLAVSNSVRYLRIVNDVEEPLKLTAIALDCKYFVFPEHFWLKYLEIKESIGSTHFEIEMKRAGERIGWQPISINPNNSIQLEGTGSTAGKKFDARLVYLGGNTILGAKSIWHHVMDAAEVDYYTNSVQQTRRLGPVGGDPGNLALLSFNSWLEWAPPGAVQRIYLVGRSKIESEFGDCGRPYVHASTSAQKCLLGMHSLRIKNDAHNIGITPLISESIMAAKALLTYIHPTVIAVEPVVLEEMENIELRPVQNFVADYWHTPTMPLVGRMYYDNKLIEKHTPKKTKYVPIELGRSVNSEGNEIIKYFKHANWTNDFQPSTKRPVLLGDVKIHPLITGAQKYAVTAVRCCDSRYSINAFKHYAQRMGTPDPEARALTFDEALNGYGLMKHLVMKTGPGYWSIWFSSGKEEIFSPLEQVVREDGSVEVTRYEWSDLAKSMVVPLWKKTIVQFYDEAEKDLAAGKAMKTFWVSTLKDELVSHEKARIAKTRVFEQPCVVYTLLCRKYFGYFADWFRQRAGFRLHHGIGKDKDTVWGRYYEILRAKGGYGFDVDYKNYDGTVQPAAFEFFLQVTDYFYGLENRTQRHALIRTLQCSHHLIGDTIAESSQGNKSGNPLTDLFNSITNVWLVYVTYQMCREAWGPRNQDGSIPPCGMEGQPDDFDFLTYGDDVILTATPDCLQYFNRTNFAHIVKYMGYTVTAANKEAELQPFETLEELTFLKCPFVQRQGYVAAPLPKKVIYRELTWQTRECVGDEMLFKQRIQNGLDFMAHHGYKEYQQLRLELKELGVETEDRFSDFEINMREKQAGAIVEDGIGRTIINVDDAMLEDIDIDEDLAIDWEDSWLAHEE